MGTDDGMPSEAPSSRLEVQTGFCSERGPRPRNEDFGGVYLGTAAQQSRIGVIAALADGVGGAKGGRVAAELAVRSFVDFYLDQSDGLSSVRQKASISLDAVNRWTHAIGHADPALQDMACTFTALILRGRHAHVLHVGDTRLYRLRGAELSLLTADHTLSGAGRNHVLTRAVGASAALQIDYEMEEMRIDDRFLLCSDGVHGALSERRLHAALSEPTSSESTAEAIVTAAIAARSGDNATALVVDVIGLPAADLDELQAAAAALPIAPTPKSGGRIDGYLLGTILADGHYSRVFRAVDEIGRRDVIVKFPKPSVAGNAMLRQAFLRESWIASRVRSPWLGESLTVPADRRTCLYAVAPFYEGGTLDRRLTQEPPIRLRVGLPIAIKLSKAVVALHRAGVIHRDIKPDNVILQPDGEPRLLDLGVARVPGLEEATDALAQTDVPQNTVAPGTASYMAPELFEDCDGDPQSDLFALGVTIYRMFSRAYPYGEVEPFSRPRFERPKPLTSARPDLPAWLDRVILRAVAARREDRYADVLEFIFELEHGVEQARRAPPPRVPLYHRNPLRFWQILCAILALALAIVGLSRG
jgi:serine/threonine protein phosphatase PrpC